MSSVPLLCHAQKVASYDYTDEKPRERLRPPLPPPPSPKRGPVKLPLRSPPLPGEIPRGVCGGVLGNPPLLVSILSLDRDTCMFGDDFTFVLQLKALYPARVPVRASIADVEPTDASQSYKWRPMLLWMQLSDADNREAGIKLLELYGSPDSPGSEIELKVGEWVEMRGRARMEWKNPRPGTLQLRVPARTAQLLQATATEQRQGSFLYDASTGQENQICDHPAEWSSRGVPFLLTVTPLLPSTHH